MRWGIANVLLCIAASAAAASEPAATEVDITGLPASEQAALVPIIRAARQMDRLYKRQFERPSGDFYPAGTTKAEIGAWLATLSESERRRALDPFTTIERGRSGHFEVVPYGRHYHDMLTEAAGALREAARLTHEETLRKYLTLRAQALLDDNYYASDVAFVGLKGPIDVVLGPYEVDDDAWFGAKTSFEASIAVVDARATQHVGRISSRLQELEDHLPLPTELRGRKLGAVAPVAVLKVIYHGGLAAAGSGAAGYGLPNDLRVLDSVGSRTGTYGNILQLRYDSTFKPIADTVLADRDRSMLRFEDVRDEIMFVRLFDSLGPQFVTGTQQPITAALAENGAVANQIRSMLLSLWGHRYLVEHGYLDRREATSLYSAFLIPALARARGGLTSTPSRGSTYILNHLIEARAISWSADGRFKIDSAAADADVERAALEFISPMAKGDAAAVESLLHHYVVVSPTLHDVLARLGPAPELPRPIYRTADRLSP
jgi:hypothetical protein